MRHIDAELNIFNGLSPQERLKYYLAITQILNLYIPPNFFGALSGYYSLNELKKKWQIENTASKLKPEAAVYIHIPFCAGRRCTFCMYSSTTTYTSSIIAEYIKRIRLEYDFWREMMPERLNSLYVGGGTPSVLSPNEMREAFSLFSKFDFDLYSERTCELSPATATFDQLTTLRELGFTKVSFGIQSFTNAVLNSVNRDNVPFNRIKKLIRYAKLVGFLDINVDLLLGLPFQSQRTVIADLKKICVTDSLSVTIYAYRNIHNQSLSEETKRKKKIREILKSVYAFFEEHGWRHEAGSLDTEYNCFASPLRLQTLKPHITSYDGFRNYRLWGIGSQAIGFSPSLSYCCKSFSPYFSTSEKRYKIFEYSKKQQMQIAVCTMLYSWKLKIKNQYFIDAFGKTIEQIFPEELDCLCKLHKIKKMPYGFDIIADSPLEAAAIQKFFWDQNYLSSLVINRLSKKA